MSKVCPGSVSWLLYQVVAIFYASLYNCLGGPDAKRLAPGSVIRHGADGSPSPSMAASIPAVDADMVKSVDNTDGVLNTAPIDAKYV